MICKRRKKRKYPQLCLILLFLFSFGCIQDKRGNDTFSLVSAPPSSAEDYSGLSDNNPSSPSREEPDSTVPSSPIAQKGTTIPLISASGLVCEVQLWMPRAEVLVRLDEAQIEFSTLDNTLFNDNYVIEFTSVDCDENGNELGELWVIKILTTLVQNEYGLKIGDDEELIEKVAGKCENITFLENLNRTRYVYYGIDHSSEGEVYYRMNIFAEDGKICEWSIVPQA